MKYLTNILLTTIKKFDLYLVKSDFKLVFNKDFTRHFQSELENNQTEFHLKRFLLLWIEFFLQRVHKFSHISELFIKTWCH